MLTKLPRRVCRAAGISRMVLLVFVAASTVRTTLRAAPLFTQPALAGVSGNFFVPPASHTPPPSGQFSLILWQPNPVEKDGMLVPTRWPAGDKTGFYPASPWPVHQAAFADHPGATTVQIDGDTVGAYLNSADLPAGSPGFKLMITPQYRFPPAERVHPFAVPGQALAVSLDLQVPTAANGQGKGSNTYVACDLLFVDPKSNTQISYGTTVFFNGHAHSKEHIGFDAPSRSIMVNCPIGPENPWATPAADSAPDAGVPWQGWKTFRYSIGRREMRAALTALKEQFPATAASMEPADYVVAQVHLNAELHFETAPAELGWSMRRLRIELH